MMMDWRRRRRVWVKRWKKRRENFELLGARLAMDLFERLPERCVVPMGRGLGRLAFRLSRKHRRQALENLERTFPEWSAARRKQVAQQSFEAFGSSVVEWLYLGAAPAEQVGARVEVRGLEHLRKAVFRGRGVVVVTAHFGSWELIPLALRVRLPGQAIAVVGRPFRNQALYTQVIERRSRGGIEVLGRSALAVRRALRERAIVGVLLDQYTPERRGGKLVPFFGKRAWTAVGPATLAQRLGTPVVPMHLLPLGGGRHELVIGPEIELCQEGDEAAMVIENTRRLSLAIEGFIREHPESWLWLHHRWRHSPDC